MKPDFFSKLKRAIDRFLHWKPQRSINTGEPARRVDEADRSAREYELHYLSLAYGPWY